jgi:hypothetical protein
VELSQHNVVKAAVPKQSQHDPVRSPSIKHPSCGEAALQTKTCRHESAILATGCQGRAQLIYVTVSIPRVCIFLDNDANSSNKTIVMTSNIISTFFLIIQFYIAPFWREFNMASAAIPDHTNPPTQVLLLNFFQQSAGSL